MHQPTADINQPRFSPSSAQGIILDLHFLSSCDYLVCTFGSNVCRLAYELMQTRFPDGAWRYRSLDEVYPLDAKKSSKMVAIYSHLENKERNEIELNEGDEVTYITYWDGNRNGHWNGYSNVQNVRTKMRGFVPSYKIERII